MADIPGQPGPSKIKKLKIEENIFATFHEKYSQEDKDLLYGAIKTIVYNPLACGFKVLSIESANCSESVSFKNAYIKVNEHVEILYNFGGIFTKGLVTLSKFMKSKAVPENPDEQAALEVLLQYLLDKDVTKALSVVGRSNLSEADIRIVLINHLFLRITPNAGCILNSGVNYNFDCQCSPERCDYHFQARTKTDDTSIGNPAVWHGRIDALIGTVAVASVKDEVIRSSVEVKKRFVDIDAPHPQIISQAIVFSFLQKKKYKKQSLIPTIGISSSEMIIYLYDSENDILLQNLGFNFTDGGQEQLVTIIAAWLVVNYEVLCDGLVGNLTTAPKANFFALCDRTALEIYKSELMHRGVGKGIVQRYDRVKYQSSKFDISPVAQEIKDLFTAD